MTWRVARSLERLREQVNQQFPNRNKSADGTIGDAAHRQRQSDHNPNSHGVVCALDLTHDPVRGPNTHALGEFLRTQRDPRISYVISNRRIFSSTRSPWVWRPYVGNPHSHHVHISVRPAAVHYDDARDWALAWGAPSPSGEPPLVRPVLRLTSRGDAVKDLQHALELAQIDGIFGPVTDVAVRAFQLEQQITVDGIVGPATWQKLDVIGEQD